MDFIDWLSKLNWQTIIGMAIIGWYFTKDFRDEMKNFRDEMKALNISINKLDADIRQQGQTTDKLYEMFCTLQSQIKDELLIMKKEHYDFMKKTRE